MSGCVCCVGMVAKGCERERKEGKMEERGFLKGGHGKGERCEYKCEFAKKNSMPKFSGTFVGERDTTRRNRSPSSPLSCTCTCVLSNMTHGKQKEKEVSPVHFW